MKKYFILIVILFIVLGTDNVRAQRAGEVESDTSQTEEQVAPAPVKKRGIFSWFTDFFDRNNKSKEEPANLSISQKYAREFAKMDLEEINYRFIEYSKESNFDALVQLLKYGANINTVNSQGRTALIEAARLGNSKVVIWLIDRGANVNYKDMYDGNALIYATQSGKRDIVKILLQNGARKEVGQ